MDRRLSGLIGAQALMLVQDSACLSGLAGVQMLLSRRCQQKRSRHLHLHHQTKHLHRTETMNNLCFNCDKLMQKRLLLQKLRCRKSGLLQAPAATCRCKCLMQAPASSACCKCCRKRLLPAPVASACCKRLPQAPAANPCCRLLQAPVACKRLVQAPAASFRSIRVAASACCKRQLQTPAASACGTPLLQAPVASAWCKPLMNFHRLMSTNFVKPTHICFDIM